MITAGGTVHNAGMYNNHGCRCDVCRAAHTAACGVRRSERYAYTARHGLPLGVEHNAWTYNNWGCRCDACRGAHAATNIARYHARKRAAA